MVFDPDEWEREHEDSCLVCGRATCSCLNGDHAEIFPEGWNYDDGDCSRSITPEGSQDNVIPYSDIFEDDGEKK
jgi:hypothetical protein